MTASKKEIALFRKQIRKTLGVPAGLKESKYMSEVMKFSDRSAKTDMLILQGIIEKFLKERGHNVTVTLKPIKFVEDKP